MSLVGNTVRKIKFIFLLWGIVFLESGTAVYAYEFPPKARQGVLDLRNWDFEEKGKLVLKGEWEFYWKALIAPEEFNNNKPFLPLYHTLPTTWNDEQVQDKSLGAMGYATLRLQILLPPQESDFALFLTTFGTAARIYANEELVYQAGRVGPDAQSSFPDYAPQIIRLPQAGAQLELLIQVSNYHYAKGGAWTDIYFGKEKQLYAYRKSWLMFDMFLVGTLLMMTFYHFGLYWVRPLDRVSLFFGLLCAMVSFRVLSTGQYLVIDLFPISWEWVVRFEYLSYYLSFGFFTLFAHSVFEKHFHHIWANTLKWASWIFSLGVVLTPPVIFTYTILPFELITIVGGAYFCFVLWKSYRSKEEEAIAFSIGFGILFLTVINDILFNNEVIHSSNLGQLGVFCFIFAQSFMLSQKFSRSFKSSEILAQRLDNINQDLEQKINIRTKDLASAHRALQKTYEKVKRKNQELEKLNTVLVQAREQNLKFFSLVDNTSDFVFLADMEGEIIYYNQAFRNFLRDIPEPKLPKHIIDLNQFLSSGQNLKELDKILRKEGSVKQEVLIIHPEEQVPLDMDGLAFYIKDKVSEEALGMALVLRDITELKKSERLVLQANEEIYLKSREIIAQKQALEEAYQDIERLSEVGRKITRNLSLDKILESFFYEINKMMDAHIFAIGLYRAQQDCLEFRKIEKGELSSSSRIALHQEDFACVQSFTRQTMYHSNGTPPEDLTKAQPSPYLPEIGPVASVIYLPLVFEQVPLGVLTVQSLLPHAYKDQDINVLKTLSTYVSIAISNAKIYRELEIQKNQLGDTIRQLKNTQKQLIQSEKMAALGQLVAGIAHEINSPVGAISSSAHYLSSFAQDTISEIPNFFHDLPPRIHPYFNDLLGSYFQGKDLSIKEARKHRRRLAQTLSEANYEKSELLADLLVNLKVYEMTPDLEVFLKEENHLDWLKMAYRLARVQKSTDNIRLAIDKTTKIIFALKTYARFDYSEEKVKASLKDGIDTVLTLYHNKIKYNVELVRDYQELEDIYCFPDELNQVWTNLIHNALQAMEYQGRLEIKLHRQNSFQVVEVKDDGLGVPESIQDKIFVPFFTTKQVGEGSGLGLSISKEIVEKHNGFFQVESDPGLGSTFRVFLPIHS